MLFLLQRAVSKHTGLNSTEDTEILTEEFSKSKQIIVQSKTTVTTEWPHIHIQTGINRFQEPASVRTSVGTNKETELSRSI